MTQGYAHFSPELQCLAALKQARANFFADVVAAAERQAAADGLPELSREDRKILRSDGVAQVAEFFFALGESGASTPDDLKDLLRRHNTDMRAMLNDCVKGYTRFGLSAARLKQALFTEHQIDLIVHESAHGPITFDQRSIGKILTQVMSFESCRTVLVLLARSGLLIRRDFRSMVLISSNGRLEDLYKKHLTFILDHIHAMERAS